MKKELTKQDILDLFTKSDKRFEERLKKESEERKKSSKEFNESLEKRRQESDREDKKIRKQVAELCDEWGEYSEELVIPKIADLFLEKGIELNVLFPHVKIKKNGIIITEIDILLANDTYSVVIEIKNTLRHKDIDEHLQRLEKIQQNPTKIVENSILLGAIGGMVVSESVFKYAVKKGLFVIKQKGDTIEIGNDDKFKPKEWKIKS